METKCSVTFIVIVCLFFTHTSAQEQNNRTEDDLKISGDINSSDVPKVIETTSTSTNMSSSTMSSRIAIGRGSHKGRRRFVQPQYHPDQNRVSENFCPPLAASCPACFAAPTQLPYDICSYPIVIKVMLLSPPSVDNYGHFCGKLGLLSGLGNVDVREFRRLMRFSLPQNCECNMKSSQHYLLIAKTTSFMKDGPLYTKISFSEEMIVIPVDRYTESEMVRPLQICLLNSSNKDYPSTPTDGQEVIQPRTYLAKSPSPSYKPPPLPPPVYPPHLPSTYVAPPPVYSPPPPPPTYKPLPPNPPVYPPSPEYKPPAVYPPLPIPPPLYGPVPHAPVHTLPPLSYAPQFTVYHVPVSPSYVPPPALQPYVPPLSSQSYVPPPAPQPYVPPPAPQPYVPPPSPPPAPQPYVPSPPQSPSPQPYVSAPPPQPYAPASTPKPYVPSPPPKTTQPYAMKSYVPPAPYANLKKLPFSPVIDNCVGPGSCPKCAEITEVNLAEEYCKSDFAFLAIVTLPDQSQFKKEAYQGSCLSLHTNVIHDVSKHNTKATSLHFSFLLPINCSCFPQKKGLAITLLLGYQTHPPSNRANNPLTKNFVVVYVPAPSEIKIPHCPAYGDPPPVYTPSPVDVQPYVPPECPDGVVNSCPSCAGSVNKAFLLQFCSAKIAFAAELHGAGPYGKDKYKAPEVEVKTMEVNYYKTIVISVKKPPPPTCISGSLKILQVVKPHPEFYATNSLKAFVALSDCICSLLLSPPGTKLLVFTIKDPVHLPNRVMQLTKEFYLAPLGAYEQIPICSSLEYVPPSAPYNQPPPYSVPKPAPVYTQPPSEYKPPSLSPPVYKPAPSPPSVYEPPSSPPPVYLPTPSPIYKPTPSPLPEYKPASPLSPVYKPVPPPVYKPAPPPVYKPAPAPVYEPAPPPYPVYEPSPPPPPVYKPVPALSPVEYEPSPPPPPSEYKPVPLPSPPVYVPSSPLLPVYNPPPPVTYKPVPLPPMEYKPVPVYTPAPAPIYAPPPASVYTPPPAPVYIPPPAPVPPPPAPVYAPLPAPYEFCPEAEQSCPKCQDTLPTNFADIYCMSQFAMIVAVGIDSPQMYREIEDPRILIFKPPGPQAINLQYNENTYSYTATVAPGSPIDPAAKQQAADQYLCSKERIKTLYDVSRGGMPREYLADINVYAPAYCPDCPVFLKSPTYAIILSVIRPYLDRPLQLSELIYFFPLSEGQFTLPTCALPSYAAPPYSSTYVTTITYSPAVSAPKLVTCDYPPQCTECQVVQPYSQVQIPCEMQFAAVIEVLETSGERSPPTIEIQQYSSDYNTAVVTLDIKGSPPLPIYPSAPMYEGIQSCKYAKVKVLKDLSPVPYQEPGTVLTLLAASDCSCHLFTVGHGFALLMSPNPINGPTLTVGPATTTCLPIGSITISACPKPPVPEPPPYNPASAPPPYNPAPAPTPHNPAPAPPPYNPTHAPTPYNPAPAPPPYNRTPGPPPYIPTPAPAPTPLQYVPAPASSPPSYVPAPPPYTPAPSPLYTPAPPPLYTPAPPLPVPYAPPPAPMPPPVQPPIMYPPILLQEPLPKLECKKLTQPNCPVCIDHSKIGKEEYCNSPLVLLTRISKVIKGPGDPPDCTTGSVMSLYEVTAIKPAQKAAINIFFSVPNYCSCPQLAEKGFALLFINTNIPITNPLILHLNKDIHISSVPVGKLTLPACSGSNLYPRTSEVDQIVLDSVDNELAMLTRYEQNLNTCPVKENSCPKCVSMSEEALEELVCSSEAFVVNVNDLDSEGKKKHFKKKSITVSQIPSENHYIEIMLKDYEYEDVCSLPKQTGKCNSPIQRFYYDADDEECREFEYSGCGGNANNFNTKADCLEACLHDIYCDEGELDIEQVMHTQNNFKYDVEHLKYSMPEHCDCPVLNEGHKAVYLITNSTQLHENINATHFSKDFYIVPLPTDQQDNFIVCHTSETKDNEIITTTEEYALTTIENSDEIHSDDNEETNVDQRNIHDYVTDESDDAELDPLRDEDIVTDADETESESETNDSNDDEEEEDNKEESPRWKVWG